MRVIVSTKKILHKHQAHKGGGMKIISQWAQMSNILYLFWRWNTVNYAFDFVLFMNFIHSYAHASVFLLETQRESPAEELPFEDGSVDLVTTMSAFHWFDRSRFLQEAHRVLKPHGCIAILNYTMDMELSYGDCSETLNHICKDCGNHNTGISVISMPVSCLNIFCHIIYENILELENDQKVSTFLLLYDP